MTTAATGAPDWIPATLRGDVTAVAAEDQHVEIRTQTATISFEEAVPAGWQIKIVLGRPQNVSIECRQPSDGVVWVLSPQSRTRTIKLGSGLHDVQIEGRGPHQLTLELAYADLALTLSPGQYLINSASTDETSPVTYRVRTESGGATSQLVLAGTARLERLRATGRVDLQVPVENADLEATGTLTAVELSRTRVRVASLDATVRQRPLGPTVRVTGTATNCTFSCQGDIHLSTVTGGVTVTEAGSLVVGACEGPVDVVADSVTVRSLSGSGTVQCRTFTAEGNVLAADGGLAISASEEVDIRGTARDASLSCSGTDSLMTIGGGRRQQPHWDVTAPEVTVETVRLGTVSGATPARDTPVVRGCVIATRGSVRVLGSIESSLLGVAGQLAVTGGLDISSLDADGVPAHVPPSFGEESGFPSPEAPCIVAELIVGGDIGLASHQQIKVDAALSAASVTGGGVTIQPDGRCAAGRVVGSTVEAGYLGVLDDVDDSRLTARALMHLAKGASAQATLNLDGDGVFGGPVDAALTWSPKVGASCEPRAGASHMTVRSSTAGENEKPNLVLPEDQAVERLVLTGAMQLSVTDASPRRRTGTEPKITKVCDTVTLRADAHLYVNADRIDLGTLKLDAAGHISRVSAGRDEVVVRLQPAITPPELTVSPGPGVRFEPAVRPKDSVDTSTPPVRIRGGHTVIRTRLDAVICETGSAGEDPQLLVKAGGSIGAVSGQFHIDELRGRITAREHDDQASSRTARLIRLIWRMTAGKYGVRGAAVARLVGASSSGDDHPLQGGQLIGADITELEFPSLEPLGKLHVFDPDADTLMDHASEPDAGARKNDEEERHRGLHERAQRLKLVAELVASKANSGATRSAALWAAARAHHRAVPVHHRLERAARFVHRMLGYGYRPGPAAWTYAAWIIGLTIALTVVDRDPGCAGPNQTTFIEGPYHFGDQLLRTLLLPLSVLRLEVGVRITYAPIGCQAGWHALVFAVTALFLGFLAVAVRNYLRTPTER